MTYSDSEKARTISSPARPVGLFRYFMYRGQSMSPTFRAGHLLYVRPAAQDIVPGDVIVFTHPSRDRFITHRVVSMTDTGLITRGDNNWDSDDSFVRADQVIGRVEMIEEQGRVEPVQRGRRGLVSAKVRWRVQRMLWWPRHIIGAPYRFLRGSKTVRRLLFRIFTPHFQYIAVQTSHGNLIKVLHRGKVVARWLPVERRFECCKPYDLFLRLDTLPGYNEVESERPVCT